MRSTSAGGTPPGSRTARHERGRGAPARRAARASVAAVQCSGWATRWSASAVDPPRTARSRAARHRVVLERGDDLGPEAGHLGGGLHEPDEAQQGPVGVGHPREALAEPTGVDPVGRARDALERGVVEQGVGASRVVEAQPGDPRRHGLGGARAHRALTGSAGTDRARRARPGRGTPPTRRACCAGRSRRRAHRGSRRGARSSPGLDRVATGSSAAARCRAPGARRSVSDQTSSSASRRQLVALLDALEPGGEHHREGEVGVAGGVDACAARSRVDWPLLGLYIGTRIIAERLLWPQQM